MIPVCYTTGHPISDAVIAHASKGLGCETRNTQSFAYFDHDDELPVIYGILRGNEKVIKTCWDERRKFLYLDHGYIKPGQGAEGYFRVCDSDLQARFRPGTNPERYERLDYPFVKQEPGEVVLALCPSPYVMHFFECEDVNLWLSRIRPHLGEHAVALPSRAAGRYVHGASKVVSMQSNFAIEAIRRGLPVEFYPPMRTIRPIVHPAMETTDRRDLFHFLANVQFTLDEMLNPKIWESFV